MLRLIIMLPPPVVEVVVAATETASMSTSSLVWSSLLRELFRRACKYEVVY